MEIYSISPSNKKYSFEVTFSDYIFFSSFKEFFFLIRETSKNASGSFQVLKNGFISKIYAFVDFNNTVIPYMQINVFFARHVLLSKLQKRLSLQIFSFELSPSGFHISKEENRAKVFFFKKAKQKKNCIFLRVFLFNIFFIIRKKRLLSMFLFRTANIVANTCKS